CFPSSPTPGVLYLIVEGPMSLHFGGTPIGAMQYGGTPLSAAMLEGEIVWPAIITSVPEPPTFPDSDPWITSPAAEEVNYSVDGTAGPGNTVSVTATAESGYELDGQTEWTHEWAPLPVVTITGTTGNRSRDQFRQACIDHGTTY